MAIPVTVPRRGWNMDQGVFIGWLKADGEAVRAGEALFTIESEKATEDIEGTDDGVLHIPADAPRKGDVIAVGAVIGFVLQPGEPIPAGASLLQRHHPARRRLPRPGRQPPTRRRPLTRPAPRGRGGPQPTSASTGEARSLPAGPVAFGSAMFLRWLPRFPMRGGQLRSRRCAASSRNAC